VGFFGNFKAVNLQVFENEKELFVQVCYLSACLKREKIIDNIPIWALFL
jgi:hypothetical protein